MISMFYPGKFALYIGRDMMRQRGHRACLLLIPRPDLMRSDEEGFLILAALSVELALSRRPSLWVRNDIAEIARRNSDPAYGMVRA